MNRMPLPRLPAGLLNQKYHRPPLPNPPPFLGPDLRNLQQHMLPRLYLSRLGDPVAMEPPTFNPKSNDPSPSSTATCRRPHCRKDGKAGFWPPVQPVGPPPPRPSQKRQITPHGRHPIGNPPQPLSLPALLMWQLHTSENQQGQRGRQAPVCRRPSKLDFPSSAGVQKHIRSLVNRKIKTDPRGKDQRPEPGTRVTGSWVRFVGEVTVSPARLARFQGPCLRKKAWAV